MTEDVFRYVVSAGVILACLSMIVQACLVFGIYRTVKAVQLKVSALSDRAEPIIDSVRRFLDETRPKINDITDKAVEITATARRQVAQLDELITGAAERARAQIERIDHVVGDTVDRVQETTAAVKHTILRPVREVNGVVSGVRAAISSLARGNRASVDHATQDEEMFI